MKKNKLFGLIALVLTLAIVLGMALSANAAGSLTSGEIDKILNTTTDQSLTASPFTAAVAKVKDSVVLVRNYTTRPSSSYGMYGFGFGFGFGDDYEYGNGNTGREQLAGTGSGTVITEYGHILTNYHVIEDATRVTVFDGENEYDASVVSYSEEKDVAVLLCPEINLPAVELGDSDQLQEGEWAIVIGNPLGEKFFRSTSVGAVSAIDREVTSQSTDKYGRRGTITNTMIQVDAAINSGNSGGGMFNVLGQLMGIPSMKYTSSFFSSTSIDNIGMCVPINVAKEYIRDALEKYDAGEVDRYLADKEKENDHNSTSSTSSMLDKPRLGVTILSLDANNTAVTRGVLPRGCIVKEVETNSPAETAGIQAGDIIVELDGTVITDTAGLQNVILAHGAGDTLNVKVYRAENNPLEVQYISDIGEGEYIDLQVTLQVVEAPAA